MAKSKGSSSENITSDSTCASGKKCGGKGKWSAFNILATIVGFMLFWPIGLVVLFWICSGRDVKQLPSAIKQKWAEHFGNDFETSNYFASSNVVFNEFQQTQYDRISEIKEEIKDQSNRFMDFRMNAKRRADEEEFKTFMANSPTS